MTKKCEAEAKRRARFEKYKREVEELTVKATGKKGLISFYKNETKYFQKAGSNNEWSYYYCTKQHLPLMYYFTKGKLQLFEQYMPDYDEFVLKYYNICADLHREATQEVFGHDTYAVREFGQHYCNGWILPPRRKLMAQLKILDEARFTDSVCEKHANTVCILTSVLPRDILNEIQSFLWPKYKYIL
jgi:hypothetical protein